MKYRHTDDTDQTDKHGFYSASQNHGFRVLFILELLNAA